jgi:hypothetical protein
VLSRLPRRGVEETVFGSYPIVIRDESRLAVNAIEMFLTGPGLVTTYNFESGILSRPGYSHRQRR